MDSSSVGAFVVTSLFLDLIQDSTILLTIQLLTCAVRIMVKCTTCPVGTHGWYKADLPAGGADRLSTKFTESAIKPNNGQYRKIESELLKIMIVDLAR